MNLLTRYNSVPVQKNESDEPLDMSAADRAWHEKSSDAIFGAATSTRALVGAGPTDRDRRRAYDAEREMKKDAADIRRGNKYYSDLFGNATAGMQGPGGGGEEKKYWIPNRSSEGEITVNQVFCL